MATESVVSPASGFNLTSAAGSMKLDSSNYLGCRLHIESLLEAHGLLEFISGSSNEPPQTIVSTGKTAASDTTSKSTVVPNPDYQKWRRLDRLVFHVLITSMTRDIVSTIDGKDSARQVWEKIYTQFGKPSRGRIRQLKRNLDELTRAPNQSVVDFAYGVKARTDELIRLGEKISADDLNETILKKLGDQYVGLKQALEVRDTAMEFEELIDRLLNSQVQDPVSLPLQPASAFVALPRANSMSFSRPNQQQWRAPNPSPFPQTAPVPQGYNQRPLNQTPRPIVPPRPNENRKPRKLYQGYCNLCNAQGYSAKFCPIFPQASVNNHQQQQFRPSKPQANFAATAQSQANNSTMLPTSPWLLDTGASHHVTSDIHNLNLHNSYGGSDGLLIGDGTSLPVSHTGSTHPEDSPSWTGQGWAI